MNKLARATLSAVGALLLLTTPSHAQARDCARLEAMTRAELATVLHHGGFTGVLDDSATIRFAGCAGARGTELGVFMYERVWGQAGRMTSRLIFVSPTAGYVGMYAVADPPSAVEPGRIVFPYPTENEIVIRGGKLPATVLLDGEPASLFK